MYDTFMYASFVNNTMCFQCFSESVVNLNQQYRIFSNLIRTRI